MKVTRECDTVIVEMDINLAEKVLEVLRQVQDWTDVVYDSDFEQLRDELVNEADVRAPSPLYIAWAESGDLVLRRTTLEEMEIREFASRKRK